MPDRLAGRCRAPASRCSSVPSSASATCAQPDRAGRSRSRHHQLREVLGRLQPALEADGALVERARSSRPTGAARFCACSACTTCGHADARRLAGRPGGAATVSSRSTPPDHRHLRHARHRAQLARDAGSAMRVSSAVEHASRGERQRDDRLVATGRTGVRIGSSISGGRSARMVEMASRMSCEACLDVLLEVEEAR